VAEADIVDIEVTCVNVPYCGDGTCNNGETCSTCSTDCGTCSSGGGGGGGGGSIDIPEVSNVSAISQNGQITVSWKNPSVTWYFAGTKIFRKKASAPSSLYDTGATLVFTGNKLIETYTDNTGLEDNQTYYYAVYGYYGSYHSDPIIIPVSLVATTTGETGENNNDNTNNEDQTNSSSTAETENNNENQNQNQNQTASYHSLYGVSGEIADQISLQEAEQLIEQATFVNLSEEGKTIYSKIISLSERELTQNDRYQIANFIHGSAETTKILGAGERAGTIASFQAAFGRLPQTTVDWQDVIKIANGRWPEQRNQTAENQAKIQFKKIYQREPKMDDPHDNAAVTVMAYGLRPANRSLNSEKAAITTFKNIYKKSPVSAEEWDIVRAIAYSGAKR
jgi:hypothetical protein